MDCHADAAGFGQFIAFFRFYNRCSFNGFYFRQISASKIPYADWCGGAAIVMMMILYFPGLNETNIQVLMFLLGLLYSAQAIVFAVGRELSPGEAAGTAMAVTNMIVMLGAMLLQPLVGHLFDYSLSAHVGKAVMTGAMC